MTKELIYVINTFIGKSIIINIKLKRYFVSQTEYNRVRKKFFSVWIIDSSIYLTFHYLILESTFSKKGFRVLF